MGRKISSQLENIRRRIKGLDRKITQMQPYAFKGYLLRIFREELDANSIKAAIFCDNYGNERVWLIENIAKSMSRLYSNDSTQKNSEFPEYDRCSSNRIESPRSEKTALMPLQHPKPLLLAFATTTAEMIMLSNKFIVAEYPSKTKKKRKKQGKTSKTKMIRRIVNRCGARDSKIKIEKNRLYISSDKKGLIKISKNIDEIHKKARSLGYSRVLLTLSA